jgi:Uma2 family endonuclease
MPALAVEVISKGNSRREMERKLLSANKKCVLRDGDTLRGGSVLPGFTLPVSELFDELSPPHDG